MQQTLNENDKNGEMRKFNLALKFIDGEIHSYHMCTAFSPLPRLITAI